MLLQALDRVGDCVAAVDRQGRVIYGNERFEELLGARPLGAHLREWIDGNALLREDTRTPFHFEEGAVERVLRGQAGSQEDVVYLKGPGAPQGMYLRWLCEPLLAPTGLELGALSILRDVTFERAQSGSLRERDEQLRAALDAVDMGTFRWDAAADVLFWDEHAARIMGLTRPSPGRIADWMARVHPDDRETLQADTRKAVADPAPFLFEYRVIRADGRVRWVQAHGRVLAREAGPVKTGVIVDITERRSAEEALRRTVEQLTRSNRDLEDFAFVASHDLQEPVRKLVSFAQLLERRICGVADEEARRYLDYIGGGARRLKELLDDLLDYSLAGRDYKIETVALEDAVQDALRTLQPRLREVSAAVDSRASGRVRADRARLTLVLRHLVDNAIKFRGPEPLRLEIRARREGARCVLTVRDNGIGIEERYFERIFQPFKRLHGKDEYPGTGIGLALCKKIVETLGGRLWVESAPDRGSAFSVELPCAQASRR